MPRSTPSFVPAANTALHHPPSPLAASVARNIRRLRLARELSLEQLADETGIPLASLEEIEAGYGDPTLEAAWKIASALEVPFAALIAEQAPRGAVVVKKSKAKVIVSRDLGLTTRALLPFEEGRGVEFYELHLAPHHKESSEAHAPGTVEFLFVAKGALEVTVGREPPHVADEGDTICFPADLPHGYRNLAAEPAILYLIMTYRTGGRTEHDLSEAPKAAGE